MFDPNPLQLKTLRLEFNDSAEANLLATFGDSQAPRAGDIGLDGVYRLSPGPDNLPVGQRGYWADRQTFVLDYDGIATLEAFTTQMRFTSDHVRLTAHERTRQTSVTIEGIAHPSGCCENTGVTK